MLTLALIYLARKHFLKNVTPIRLRLPLLGSLTI